MNATAFAGRPARSRHAPAAVAHASLPACMACKPAQIAREIRKPRPAFVPAEDIFHFESAEAVDAATGVEQQSINRAGNVKTCREADGSDGMPLPDISPEYSACLGRLPVRRFALGHQGECDGNRAAGMKVSSGHRAAGQTRKGSHHVETVRSDRQSGVEFARRGSSARALRVVIRCARRREPGR